MKPDRTHSQAFVYSMREERRERMAEPDAKPYLEYLDKEMAITGLLATFSAIVIGLTVNSSLAADRGELKNVWPYGHWDLLMASCWMLIAALLFYRQRSLRAYYYGQIALCCVQGSSGEYDKIEHALADADAWITWFFYQAAFACLITGFVTYGAALLSIVASWPRHPIVISGFGLIETFIIVVFALWNHQRLHRIDKEPRERRRSGWIAKPSNAVRQRAKRATN